MQPDVFSGSESYCAWKYRSLSRNSAGDLAFNQTCFPDRRSAKNSACGHHSVEIDSDVLWTPRSNVLPTRAVTCLKSSEVKSTPSTECRVASGTGPLESEAKQNPSSCPSCPSTQPYAQGTTCYSDQDYRRCGTDYP